MNKRKSIMMVIQSFYPLIGGAERQALVLSKALVRQGYTVQVLTRRLKGLAKNQTVENIPIHRVFSLGSNPLSSFIFMFSVFFFLWFRRNIYDVIHVHLAASHALPSMIVGSLLGKKVIVKVGGGNEIGEISVSRHTFWGRCKLWIFRQLKPSLVLVNQDQTEEMKKAGLSELQASHIANGVDNSLFQPLPEDEKKKLKEKLGWTETTFLYVGRFNMDKLTADVFKNVALAWKRFAQKGLKVDFYFVGTGPLEKKYREIIKQENVPSSLKILGPSQNVKELFQAADVFVLPSLGEGLSNALLEAMSCQLPVIGSRVTGIKEMIEEGKQGFLFDPFNEQEIEDALNKIYENKETRQEKGRQAQALAQYYSIDEVAKKYISLYETR